MIEISERTTFLRITPIYIHLGLVILLLSLFQKLLSFGDYSASVLYFSIPSVIIGTLFQMYPTLQSIPIKFSFLVYLHFSFFLISFFLYLFGSRFEEIYFLSALIFALFFLLNTRRYGGQVQLFFLVGSAFYLFASFLILTKYPNPFLIKHLLAVGFFLTIAFGSLYMLLPMLQLENLALSDYLWIHLAFHTVFTIDLLISWSRMSFGHIYVSGMLVLTSVLILAFVLYKTLSQKRSPLKGLDPSVKAFLLSLFILVFSLSVGILSAGSQDFGLLNLHTDGLLYGFFPILTLGAAYHIIPFMLWWKEYAPKMGKGKVPTLKELLPERVLEISLLILIPSLLGLILSSYLKPFVLWFFALAYTAGIGYFLFQSFPLTLKQVLGKG